MRHAELDEPPAHPVDFREAMWGVVQSSVSELDFDFPAYAAKHFERLGATSGDPRFKRWLGEGR